jgi:hypothetical protein
MHHKYMHETYMYPFATSSRCFSTASRSLLLYVVDAAGHVLPPFLLLNTGGKKGFGRGWQLPLVAVAQPRPKLRD